MFLAKVTIEMAVLVALLDTTKSILMPNLSLIIWVCLLMVADFVTGIIKAKFKKEPITSERMRASIVKFLQYFGCLGLVIVLQNQKGNSPDFYRVMNLAEDGLTILILYIEALSILENLYLMDIKNPFAQFVIRPLYSLLSIAVRNNPLANEARAQKKNEPAIDKNELNDIEKAND